MNRRTELLLRAAAVLTWLVTGLPTLVDYARGGWTPAALVWLLVWVLFIAGFLWLTVDAVAPTRVAHRVALLALQTVSTLVMVTVSPNANQAACLVITASEAPYVAPRWATAWVVAQCVALMAVFVARADAAPAVVASGAYSGFQFFALATTWFALGEAEARQALARANAELVATRELMAEDTRLAERLRIARDLHDTIGHHLTALSLNLDIAGRQADGPAASRIQEAHAIAKLLLTDVRDVVSTLRRDRHVDVVSALRTLAAGIPAPTVHLAAPDDLAIDDPVDAHTLFTCVQEIITNAARHAAARHVWITVSSSPRGLEVEARDDGRGCASIAAGLGLMGMRERFEQRGGGVELQSAPGAGFAVRAWLPRAEGAA